MTRDTVTGLAQASLPLSHAVWAGDLVFLSGQASTDESGRIIAGTFEEEMCRSFENCERVLHAAGGSLADAVKVTAYLASMEHRQQFNELYVSLFDAPFPARTTLPVDFGILKFEVDIVAYIPQRRGQ